MTATLSQSDLRSVNRVPFAANRHHAWEQLRWTEIENPHVLIVGGSRTGKTTLQILIAAVAAARGCIVLVLDPKQRFSKPFRHPVTDDPLPHVLVYRNPDNNEAAEEWDHVLGLVVRQMQARYEADDARPGTSSILDDQERFPTVLVVCDELGTLLDFADKEWQHRKPEKYKGDTPIREHLHTLSRMGGEARYIGVFANQNASEKEMPAGTRTRQLCGQRIVLGYMKEGGHWRMIAGDGTPPVAVPDQKGAGVVMFGSGDPERIQCAFIDWKDHPEQVYNLAAQGVPILREQGHLDEHDRLLLDGASAPRPGRMDSHIASTGTKVRHRAEESEDGDDEPAAAEEATEETLEPTYIIGNQAGAEFCNMTVANFRRHRDNHPLPGEVANYQGNKPAWTENDLREWSLERAENRRGTKGAA